MDYKYSIKSDLESVDPTSDTKIIWKWHGVKRSHHWHQTHLDTMQKDVWKEHAKNETHGTFVISLTN